MPDHQDNSPESLIHNSTGLFNSLFFLAKELIELAHLEVKLSCQNFIIAIGLLFFIGMLIISSWIALLIGSGLALYRYGISWQLTCLLILLFNIGLLSLCVGLLKYFFSNIGLSATLKNLALIKAQEKTNEPTEKTDQA